MTAPVRAARLLFPAIRWDPESRDWDVRDRLADYTALGVGGFIVFGGSAPAVRSLVRELRTASPHPILLAADLERGAGQQFRGATPLPPAAALAHLDDPAASRRAGALTGREARALGIDWVFAPVADVDLEPANPIVGTRSFGSRPDRAAAHVAAWVAGCAPEAMACAKHFPGHGRTTADSHLALPVVDASRDALADDLAPFRAAIDAGVPSIMTAHVAYPALDGSGRPATRSRPILGELLREELGFDGVVVTDALVMAGAAAGGDDGVGAAASTAAQAAVEAVAAGCDALLYPADPQGVARALETAGDGLDTDRLDEAIRRIATAAEQATKRRSAGDVGRAEDQAWALDTAVRTVHAVRGDAALTPSIALTTVDDDVGGPYPPPPRDRLAATLRAAGVRIRDGGSDPEAGAAGYGGAARTVVAVYADIRGFKGRPGLSPASLSRVRRVVESEPSALVILFGHPRLAGGVPGEHLLCAWGGEPLMQEAAARWLVDPVAGPEDIGRRGGPGWGFGA